MVTIPPKTVPKETYNNEKHIYEKARLRFVYVYIFVSRYRDRSCNNVLNFIRMRVYREILN
jgi:hypothetical protein